MMMLDVPWFSTNLGPVNDEDDVPKPTKSKKNTSGGFQSMNLNYSVLKGVLKRGYKQPTPIQRKTIPLILEGRDVVAMARTGSGKTAAFLIPLLEKLKGRSAKAGARALILSPTRELALQTLKFLKELGKFVGLKGAVILGGDSMDDQFTALHGNPDVIVATPGRFLHVCIEMDLKLHSIEYVVFDEADRLFEMGLQEELSEIIGRLPDTRQTVLFSATLPKVLVEFAKVGLSDPILLRLDVESKLPDGLRLEFFIVRHEEKVAALLELLQNIIRNDEQTVVFVATKHHVEYLHMLLDQLHITNTYIYSNLDPSARKIHAAKFQHRQCRILLVTDVAARGIDIPHLDNVINFNFPAKPKLFVHRVGRVARAGRSGCAYSLIGSDEHAHLLDLFLFLGRTAPVGRMPQGRLEDQISVVHSIELPEQYKTMENGYKQYMKSRPQASSDSCRRVKEYDWLHNMHPMFSEPEVEMVKAIRNYRPHGTIFEICGKNNAPEYVAMKLKRQCHRTQIEEHQNRRQKLDNVLTQSDSSLTESTSHDVRQTFKTVIEPRKFRQPIFVPYAPRDQHTEQGLAVNFHNEAAKVTFDLTADSSTGMTQQRRWDRVKKKMVTVENAKKGKIRTESGAWIAATYKSDRYATWRDRTKVQNNDTGEEEESGVKVQRYTHWAKHNAKLKLKLGKSELRSTEQVLKARELLEKKMNRHNKKKKKKKKSKRR